MILVDTSVWIEYLKQHSSYVKEMEPLLKSRLVITIEPIFSELLYGVRHRQDREIIMSFWNILPRIDFGSNSMFEASRFANGNNYYHRGIGLMDAIIIKSAMDGNHSIWTLDIKINNNIDKKYLYQNG
jgi:predicted nucleic acid-binding protein